MCNVTYFPGPASPSQRPNQRAVQSGSVTLFHTSSMLARKVRVRIRKRPLNGSEKANQKSASATTGVCSGPKSPRS